MLDTLSVSLITYFASQVIAGVVLWLFLARVTRGPDPSGPAAIGRALGFLILFEILGVYLLKFLFTVASWLLAPDVQQTLYQAAITLLFLVVPLGTGFLAARTTEDAHSMNYKILSIVGLLPHAIISFVALPKGPINLVVFGSFAPLVVVSGYLKARQYRLAQAAPPSDELA